MFEIALASADRMSTSFKVMKQILSVFLKIPRIPIFDFARLSMGHYC